MSLYANTLRSLLPPGALWKQGLETKLYALLEGLGVEFERVEARGKALIEEADPRTATETLEDWERMLALPDDDVLEIPASVEARRLAVVQKYIRRGGQNAPYYIRVAAACGYTVTIRADFGKGILRAGFRAGARCFTKDWAHVWRMTVQPPTGTALTHAELERIITRVSPEHTAVLFTYL